MHATTVANPQAKTAAGFGWILVLAGLLAAQIGLALFLGLRGAGPSTGGRDTPLLSFDPAKVERIRIEHRGTDPVVLERTDKGWQVQTLAGFPAAQGRVDTLLERLAGLKRGLPVATSQESLARLKVADTDHEGRLSVEGGGQELAALYLGETGGARRQYLRASGDTAVYEVALSPADIPAKADDWADRTLLNLDDSAIDRIELPGLTLEKAEGSWRLADAKEGEALDPAKAADLARRLASLSFVSVLGTEAKPEYGQDAPALEWHIGLASGDTRDYRLSRLQTEPGQAPAAQGEANDAAKPRGPQWYVVKVSDRPYYLKIASYTADGLLNATREGLLAKPEAAPTASPALNPGEAGEAPQAAKAPNPPPAQAADDAAAQAAPESR